MNTILLNMNFKKYWYISMGKLYRPYFPSCFKNKISKPCKFLRSMNIMHKAVLIDSQKLVS